MFENRIGYWTKKKGIKHSHIAKLCGVSNQTFSRWVNNKTQPDIIQSFIIARALGVKIDDLIRRKDEENEK